MSTQNRIASFDHFIPVSTQLLISKLPLTDSQRPIVTKLKRILEFEYYQKLEKLKSLYQPFNPDRELLLNDKPENHDDLCMEQIHDLLVAANYTKLEQQQIAIALEKTSPYGLEISIDFDAFKHLSLYFRGKSSSTLQVRDWKSAYLKKKNVTLTQYQRLFLMLQYKDPEKNPGIHLKLFKDILRPDLEMLFPENKVKMKVIDKAKLAITGGGGTAGGLFATIGKISAAVSPWTILIAIAGFAMLIWRQVSKIFIQKTRYMATLAQNLYFHNLDNNAGAITFMVDQARQEEVKETLLAYAMLQSQPIDSEEMLDTACEEWFLQQYDRQIDFDVSDSVKKLKRLKVLKASTQGLSCQPVEKTAQQLDEIWNSLMQESDTSAGSKNND